MAGRKHGSTDKAPRRCLTPLYKIHQVVLYCRANPQASYSHVARVTGVSRARCHWYMAYALPRAYLEATPEQLLPPPKMRVQQRRYVPSWETSADA